MGRVPTDVRSRVMASVRSSRTRLEDRAAAVLRESGITGYRRWYQKLPGRPDFVFRKQLVALFIESCFWHGCKKHLRMPVSNVSYWNNEISRNRARDSEVRKSLSELGWMVVR